MRQRSSRRLTSGLAWMTLSAMTTLSSGRGRATMVDVARRANVSIKTVSRVVNGEDGVRPETAESVQAAIQDLGFRRNAGARQLRRGPTASIGLVVEDLADPYYSALAAACERVARERDHVLITGSAEGSPAREESVVDVLLSRQVDGLLIVPAGAECPWLTPEIATRTPAVFIDRPVRDVAADLVVTDNEGGIASAVDHLAQSGHRRIGFLGDDETLWTAQQRRRGFMTATASMDASCQQHIAMGPHDVGRLTSVLRRWLHEHQPISALVTGNNRVTVATLRALRELADARFHVQVMGFDDFELADVVDPPVSVVAQDPAQIGAAAAELLFARLSGDRSAPRTVTMPTRLVTRDQRTASRGAGSEPPP